MQIVLITCGLFVYGNKSMCRFSIHFVYNTSDFRCLLWCQFYMLKLLGIVLLVGCSTFSLNLETTRVILLLYGWLDDLDVAVNWLFSMRNDLSKLLMTYPLSGMSMAGNDQVILIWSAISLVHYMVFVTKMMYISFINLPLLCLAISSV